MRGRCTDKWQRNPDVCLSYVLFFLRGEGGGNQKSPVPKTFQISKLHTSFKKERKKNPREAGQQTPDGVRQGGNVESGCWRNAEGRQVLGGEPFESLVNIDETIRPGCKTGGFRSSRNVKRGYRPCISREFVRSGAGVTFAPCLGRSSRLKRRRLQLEVVLLL